MFIVVCSQKVVSSFQEKPTFWDHKKNDWSEMEYGLAVICFNEEDALSQNSGGN